MKIRIIAVFFLLAFGSICPQTFFTSVPEISNVVSIIEWKDEVWVATYGKGIFMYDRSAGK